MKPTFRGILLASFGLLLTAIPVLAHHTIAAEFDTRDTVTLAGRIHEDRLDQPSHLFLHGREGRQRQREKLEPGNLSDGLLSSRRHHPRFVQAW